MITELVPLTKENIVKAAKIIKNGGLVGIPTETVYGLGANALDVNAVNKIFTAKGRPQDNPLIVHVADIKEIAPLIEGDMPNNAKILADKFWPGPMTLIMKKSALVPGTTTGGLDTVAIRLPNKDETRELIKLAGVPIAAPSGNLSGRPSPTKAIHMLNDMDGRIPLILDGGASQVGVESTVIDTTVTPVRVLRPGGITPEMIKDVLGDVDVDPSLMRPLNPGEEAKSPGMKYKHYAPKGEITIFTGNEQKVADEINMRYDVAKNAVILALEGHMALYGKRRVLSLGKNSNEAAEKLFDVLRSLDTLNVDTIFSEAVDKSGMGLAVMNRLGRAAAFKIINCE